MGTSQVISQVRRRARERDDGGWIILRTNSRRTLPLARSLIDVGIEAWSPQEVRQRRLPRSRAFREYAEAIVPSFVFVRAAQLHDVSRAHSLPGSPHPSFSIFSYGDRVPVIADRDVGELRKREDLARIAYEAAQERARVAARRALRRDVEVGSSVRLTDGAYAGLDGVVTKVAGDEVTITLNGQFPVKVASWLLLNADVEAPAVLRNIAA